jgi:hypothetical protein
MGDRFSVCYSYLAPDVLDVPRNRVFAQIQAKRDTTTCGSVRGRPLNPDLAVAEHHSRKRALAALRACGPALPCRTAAMLSWCRA